MSKLRKVLQSLLPFVLIGVFIAVAMALLIIFSYLLIWGILIGGIIALVALIRNYFFMKKTKTASGRIIEHEDHDHNKE